MPTLADSSPLILFAAIGRLDLLHQLFGRVIVTPAVWREVVETRSGLYLEKALYRAILREAGEIPQESV